MPDNLFDVKDKMFFNSEIAFKYKMSSMQAALGIAQLERIEDLINKKRLIFKWYRDNLSNFEGISLNSQPPGTKNTYWMVTAIIDRKFEFSKEQLIEIMRERGIDCRPFFYPLSSIPAYKDFAQSAQARGKNHHSYRISPYGINLPSGLNLTKEKVEFICDTLTSILTEGQPS